LGCSIGSAETIQNPASVLFMVGKGIGEDHDVVKVDNADIVDQFPQCFLKTRLVDGGCVGESHRHDSPLI
jgi:hypothetical protein